LDQLHDLGPLPEDITVHLDAGYDPAKTRDELTGREMTGQIAHRPPTDGTTGHHDARDHRPSRADSHVAGH
jgi:IS5 family transposase